MADLRQSVRGAIRGQRDRGQAEDLQTPPQASGKKVGAGKERPTVERVWNLTDDPEVAGGGQAKNLAVVGRTLLPGRALELPVGTVKANAKLQEDVARGLLYVGHQPPQAYLDAKNRIRERPAREASRRLSVSSLQRERINALGECRQLESKLKATSEELDKVKATIEKNKADRKYTQKWRDMQQRLQEEAAGVQGLIDDLQMKVAEIDIKLSEQHPDVPVATVERLEAASKKRGSGFAKREKVEEATTEGPSSGKKGRSNS